MNQRSFQPVPSAFLQAPADDGIVLDFGKIFSILRGGWWIIGAAGFTGALFAAVLVLRMEPTFSARAQLLMGTPNGTGNVFGTLVQDLNLDDDAIAGEIAIITSGRILNIVSQRLDLESRPEFNVELRPPEPEAPWLLEKLDQAAEGLKTVLSGGTELATGSGRDGSSSADPVDNAAYRGQDLLGDQVEFVSLLMRSLQVDQVGNTGLVNVSFSSTNRALAAAIPNAVVDVYLEDQLNRKFEALRRLTDGLETRLSKMRGRLEASERAVIDYRNRNLADGFAVQARLDQQLTDLTRRLNQSSADQAALDAQVAGIDAIIASQGALAAAGLFESNLIETMRSQIIELQQRKALVAERSSGDNAQTAKFDEEISRLETMIEAEVTRLRDDKFNQAEISRAAVEALNTELKKLEVRAIQQAEREVRLSQLTRDHAAELAVYGTFLDKFTETSEALDLQEGDAQVISFADPPKSPVAPNKKVAVALGGIAGGFFGVGLVFLLAMTDRRVRTRAQLRSMAPYAPIVSLQRTGRFGMKGASPLSPGDTSGAANLSDGIQAIRSQVLMSEKREGGRILSVVSAGRDAGKTTTGLLLMRSFAQMGVSCVLVEADLRNPSVGSLLGLKGAADLVDVLSGKAKLEQALEQDPASSAKILKVRKGHRDPAGVLLSPSMTQLLQDLRKTYAVVIVDTSPLLSASDATPLVKMADHVLLVVRHASPRDEVDACLETIEKLGSPQLSICLSMTSRRSEPADRYA
ncbi:polysaccharide biosynthesis tyrosine autokinase [Poseidonocella sp. HB161398]|uniref:GumC family protein n=1 Tax=Poseidonocella sp. HB161398 TaxID=2320855 RepID=UPI001108803B|nr:polysaccharide biosynthesis tyrosine autokinase [Poseidonocella sp. HB161398]